MNRILKNIIIVSILLGVISSPLYPFQFKKGNDIYLSNDFNEDLVLAGSVINFDGHNTGDLIGFARSVTFGGMIDGNLIAAAQKVTINGEIMRGARCFSQSMYVNGHIDGDVLCFASDATISNDAVIGRDCVLFAGEVIIDGTVSRNVKIEGGQVNIAGKIDGDVYIKADDITISPTAVIGGELSYESKDKAKIAPEAQIAGETKWKKKTAASESSGPSTIPPPVGVFWTTIFILGTIILGVIWILLSRDSITKVENEVRTNSVVSGLVGLLGIFILPVLFILVGVTLIGIPVAVTGLMFYIFALFAAEVPVAITVGMLLMKLMKKSGKISLGVSLLIGVALIEIALKIPVLGWIVFFLQWALGLGALIVALLRKKKVVATATATVQT